MRPAAHYTMGGIHENIDGQVMKDDSSHPVEGLWAAGECGCVSVHGANRLGSNSLSHCIIWGRMTGEAAQTQGDGSACPAPCASEVRDQIDAAAHRVETIRRTREEGEEPYQLRKELWETMDANVHVYRDIGGAEKARRSSRSSAAVSASIRRQGQERPCSTPTCGMPWRSAT